MRIMEDLTQVANVSAMVAREGRRKMFRSKKRRHERFTVRAGRPVTQTTSSFGAIRETALHHRNIYTVP